MNLLGHTPTSSINQTPLVTTQGFLGSYALVSRMMSVIPLS